MFNGEWLPARLSFFILAIMHHAPVGVLLCGAVSKAIESDRWIDRLRRKDESIILRFFN